MSTRIKSTLILAFARITNFALVFFSPILLVRILDQTSFGQYREFIAWSMIVIGLTTFAIGTNLLYFVPRHPENAKQYVSNTNWLSFAASLLSCAAMWIFDDQIRASTNFDFVVPLILYVLLFCNVTYLESYWIATKQPGRVFYYSTLRTVARLGAVIGTAWMTRSVESILVALIAVEVLRVVLVLIISIRDGLLSFSIDRDLTRQQLGFIVPLGFASSLQRLHMYVGQVVIASQLGVLALGIYSVASYKVPIVRIVRGAVSDAIFPDMVRQAASDQRDRLRLWKRGNIAYASLIIPVFLLLFWYADVLIPLVFTDKYADAVPIFRILLLLMPLEAIELNSPLRAANQTRYVMIGNLLMFGTNLLCIFAFFRWLPDRAIIGPAVGVVLGAVVERLYMARQIIRHYDVNLPDMLKWRSLGIVLICTSLAALCLWGAGFLPWPELARMLAAVPVFGVAYYLLLRSFRLEEVETVVTRVQQRLRRGVRARK